MSNNCRRVERLLILPLALESDDFRGGTAASVLFDHSPIAAQIARAVLANKLCMPRRNLAPFASLTEATFFAIAFCAADSGIGPEWES